MVGSFIQNDLDIYFDTNDFGSTILFTPQPSGTVRTFNGIFDDAQDVYDVNSQTFLTSMPQVITKTVNVSGIGINDKVNVNSQDYFVMRSKADGDGVTTILLSKGKVSI